jgi:hypothetical protein
MAKDPTMHDHSWIEDGRGMSAGGGMTVWKRAGRYHHIMSDGPPNPGEGGYADLDALMERMVCRPMPSPRR